MSKFDSEPVIQIVGAGPSGLAAAITLALAGRRVLVHEAQSHVGYRFGRDLQGLENWTVAQDVLVSIRDLGIRTDFRYLACNTGTAFDAWGSAYPIRTRKPLCYLVERGPGPKTLDTALLRQAIELGVEVRFNSRIVRVSGPAIFATGPKAADAIAVGYHFDTRMQDGFWVICDNNLAPEGYAYLLVMDGIGTVKTCLFTGFKDEALYVERTVEAFKRLTGLEMINPRSHGGVGNFRIPSSALSGSHPVVGEQAGFQDTLWGFGMRFAITSGVLAARSLLEDGNYDLHWQQSIGELLSTCVLHRVLYTRLGNRGYRWLLRQFESPADAREILSRHHRPSLLKRALANLANHYFKSRRKDISCNHIDCGCVWCQHGSEFHT